MDTATTLLRFASGALGVVENSRQAVYGYDIVTEDFGEKGKLVVQAEPKTPLRHYHKEGYQLDHYHFFMDRFGPAFRAELEAFFGAVAAGKSPSPGVADALESLKIGLAATRSWKAHRPGQVSEIHASGAPWGAPRRASHFLGRTGQGESQRVLNKPVSRNS